MSFLHFRHSPSVGPSEAPPILLIHGLFGSLENLAGLAKLLSAHREVYSIDLPNHSRSGHTLSTSLEQMSAQVIAWMASQNIDHADIVGHSLGGKIAMEIALTEPSLVRRLVVIDIAPVHYNPHHSEVFQGLLSINVEDLKDRRAADAALIQHVPEADVRSFLLKNLTKQKDGLFTWRFNLPVLHECYPQLIRANREAVFAAPVLFLKGDHSDYIIEHYREAILSRFPYASVKVVENTGHWLHAQKPQVVSKLVERFLSRQT